MNTKPAWNPIEQPYRFTRFHQSSAAGCYGWVSHSFAYATLAEAEAEFKKPMPAGVFSVEVDQAVNPETWKQNGKWKQLMKRSRKK